MMIKLTPVRRLWLEKLATSNHPVPWKYMPKRTGCASAVTNQTWRPMIEAGLITGKYECRDFRVGHDWYFEITDAGRALLASEAQDL